VRALALLAASLTASTMLLGVALAGEQVDDRRR
jgi:hypothetical protein